MDDTSQPQREREQQMNAGAGMIVLAVLITGFGVWAVLYNRAGILLFIAAAACLARGVKSLRAARRSG